MNNMAGRRRDPRAPRQAISRSTAARLRALYRTAERFSGLCHGRCLKYVKVIAPEHAAQYSAPLCRFGTATVRAVDKLRVA